MAMYRPRTAGIRPMATGASWVNQKSQMYLSDILQATLTTVTFLQSLTCLKLVNLDVSSERGSGYA